MADKNWSFPAHMVEVAFQRHETETFITAIKSELKVGTLKNYCCLPTVETPTTESGIVFYISEKLQIFRRTALSIYV